jgi:hypothetical protein
MSARPNVARPRDRLSEEGAELAEDLRIAPRRTPHRGVALRAQLASIA